MGTLARCLLVACGAATAVVGFSATASDARRHRTNCRTAGGTVVANTQARVFQVGYPDTSDFRYYACDFKARHIWRLGIYSPEQGGGVANFQLVGSWLAFDYHSCPRDEGCTAFVRVLFLGTGFSRTSAIETGNSAAASDLAINPEGDVAWIRGVVGGDGRGTEEVRKMDTRGEALLDSGLDIEPGSLAVTNWRIYWTKGGQAFVGRFY